MHQQRSAASRDVSSLSGDPGSILFASGLSLAGLVSIRMLAPRTSCAAKKKKGGKGGGGGGDDGGAGQPAEEIDTSEYLNGWEASMETAVETLKEKIRPIQAGKATPALLESIKVKAYDSDMKIVELATVSVNDASTLMVTCFEESTASAVSQAIQYSELGFGVNVAGAAVKVTIPPLTTDKRAKYVKTVKESVESAKTVIRNLRQTAMKKIKSLSKQLSQDVAKGMEKDVEAMVKKYVSTMDDIFKKKETELNAV